MYRHIVVVMNAIMYVAYQGRAGEGAQALLARARGDTAAGAHEGLDK
jgi:hypothetical protein